MEVQILSPEVIQDVQPTSTHESIPPDQIDAIFSTTATDLISAPLGTRILHHSDDFFASSANLINPLPPISRPGVFIETGAWYDGWESRRHNATPPDHVTIRLGPAAGVVAGVEVDTAFFTGNYAEEIEVLGAFEPDLPADVFESNSYNKWFSLVSRRQCGPSRRHAWFVDPEAKGKRVTHVRLHMFPDGGIARFRLYGRAEPVWPSDPMVEVELSAAVNGGVAIAASDEHFGRRGNLLLPGRGKDMGDGWETKRSRGKGHVDWTIVRLGARGQVGRVVVDTMHFRGNFPRGVRVEALDAGALKEGDEDGGKMVEATDERWIEVVSTQPCEKDKEHEYTAATGTLKNCEGKAFTHLKIIMEPDGGIKRFRVFGTRSAEST